MLTHSEQEVINKATSIRPFPLSPETYCEILEKGIQSLSVEHVSPGPSDTIDGGKDVHQALTAVVDFFKKFDSAIQAERQLTAREQQLVNQLDRLIQRLCRKTVCIVKGLKDFEAIKADGVCHIC